jgi:hypothetical protein
MWLCCLPWLSGGNNLVTCPFIALSLTFLPSGPFETCNTPSSLSAEPHQPHISSNGAQQRFPDTLLIRQIPFRVLLDRQPCTHFLRLCLACCLSVTASSTSRTQQRLDSFLLAGLSTRTALHHVICFSWPQPRYLLGTYCFHVTQAEAPRWLC